MNTREKNHSSTMSKQSRHNFESLSPIRCTALKSEAYLTPVNLSTAPKSLVSHVRNCFNHEVDAANTYPHDEYMSADDFPSYWFGHAAIVLLRHSSELTEDRDWDSDMLGTYYVKPNYIGHCSHICNAGFLVPLKQRGQKYGRMLARSFPFFATQLGYESSVFNLVFETNVASTRLWDQFGYKRAGRIKNAIKINGVWDNAIIYQGDFRDGSVDISCP